MSTPTLPGWLRAAWPWLAALTSGALLALSFAPANQSWLIWIAFAPLLCAVWFTPARKPRPFLLGYLCGVVFYTGAFHWLSALGTLFQQPIMVGIPLLLALYLGLYVGFWAWSIRALAPSSTISASSSLRHLGIGALAASAWVALEWTRGWFLSGFGWDGLGVALHRNIPMIQIVDITGVLGLSWLVAFCNIMAVVIVRRLVAELGPNFLKRIRWEFSATMLLVALVFGYGARRVALPSRPPTQTLKVGAIQPNVPQDVKFNNDSEEMILRKLEQQTTYVAQLKPDVILWPEAPAVRGMYGDKMNYDFMMKLAASGSFDLLIGSLDYQPDPDPAATDKMRIYNAAFLLREHGAEQQIYHKVHLVPFGEYVPYRTYWPQALASQIVEMVGDLQAGTEPAVFTLTHPAVRVSPLICFEDSLGDLTRRSCLGGAQLLVNLTNDGWFQHTVGAEVHLANAVFRAVENRRPLVRCSNTGMTGLVDTMGRWEPWVQPFREGFAMKAVAVPLEAPTTFYMRHGDWLGYGSTGVFFLWLMVRLFARLRSRCAMPPASA